MLVVSAPGVADVSTAPQPAAPGFRFPEGTHSGGTLAYHGPIPVLRVAGGPEEIAEQSFALALRPALRLLDYTTELLAHHFRSRLLARLLVRPLDRLGRRLLPQFPPHHRRELAALARLTGDERRVVRANTLFDLKNTPPWRLFGCSSLAPAPQRSDTGGPLLARNLDFFPLAGLPDYGLVTVCRQHGCRPFASVGFPGAVGCFSGTNDAGLAVVSHEVFAPPGRGFDPRGVPFALLMRRVLEACATVGEAEAYLRSVPRATSVSLVACDRDSPAVFEMSPERVVRRDPARRVSVCTNHFVGEGLASRYPPDTFGSSRRHRLLERVAASGSRLGVADLFGTLHAVNLGPFTIQSMVFEPRRLRLHLSIGPGPTTARPPTELRLSEWF